MREPMNRAAWRALWQRPGARLALDLLLALLVFAAAIGPRLEIARGYDTPPQSEERLYNRYAIPWARGEGAEPRELAFPWHPLGSFTHRPPGYVLFLGSIYRLAGEENFAAVREVQAWMDASSMVLILVAGCLVFGGLLGRAVGFSAALLVARYDFLSLFVARLLSETLYLWLSLLFVVLALAALRWRRPSLSLAAAAALGLTNITRPFMVFVLPGYLLWLLLAPALPDKRRHLALALAGMLLTVGPVTLRNWQFHGRFILISTNGGYTFYKSLTEVPDLSAPEEIPSEESIDALGLGEVAEQAAFRRAALDYLRAHPADAPKIYARKLGILWDAKGGHRISHELMLTPDDEWLYPLVLVGALLGLALRPRLAWHPRLLLSGSIASQYLVSLIANAEVRYRVPIVPLLALLAAWLVWGLVDWVWRRPGADRAPARLAAAPSA
ncbi:MAG: glycosyltransferase family 39 protein [Caldilineae bacterium]|nr:glycosyltransferase family 39 protein [Chloroflexota bacterium]MCB9176598.1 glycosyltransferase family 39 protein [Caldilineae bacterium]